MWVNLTKWTKNGCKLVSNVNAHKRARRIFIIKLVRWLILWTSIGLFAWLPHSSHQFSSVAQLRPTLCDSMDCSMPGFPIHHHLPELAQTHVHRVSDAIQPPHPLLSPSSTAFSLSQHQDLFPVSVDTQNIQGNISFSCVLRWCWQKEEKEPAFIKQKKISDLEIPLKVEITNTLRRFLSFSFWPLYIFT